MSDVAVLGIKVDSSQVASGTTALDKFAAAAKPAAAGADPDVISAPESTQ